jgi:hypothetical protein
VLQEAEATGKAVVAALEKIETEFQGNLEDMFCEQTRATSSVARASLTHAAQ